MISVILPCYKHNAYLSDAIQSIINQTYPDWELLIFNDDPKSNLQAYKQLDIRIQVFECNERKGQAYRLNEGIYAAQGNYIAFMDADDICLPFRFEVSLINADMVYGDGIYLEKTHRNYIKATKDFTHDYLIDINNIACPFDSILIKSELAKKVKFRDEIGYGNDRVWYLDLLKQTLKIDYVPLPLIYVNANSSNFRINSKNKFQTIKARIHRKLIRRKLSKYIYENFAHISR